MKKAVSLLLVLILMLSSVSIFGSTVYAEEPSSPITVVYTKNGVETVLGNYDKLSLAAEAVGTLYEGLLDGSVTDSSLDEDTNNNNELYAAAGSPVIRINADITGDSVCPDWVFKNYDKNNVPTIVIDGAKSATENYVINCDDITLFDRLAFYNLTVRNVDMIFTRTNTGKAKADNNIRWNGNIDTNVTDNPRIPGESFTVFENCLMDQNSSMSKASGDGGLFKMNGFKKPSSKNDTVTSDIYNLTLRDCTIFSDSAVGLQVHWGADANICLENTSWTLDGVAGCGTNNDTILKCYEAGNVYMKLDGKSKLIAAREEGCQTVSLFRSLNSMGGTVKYEFDRGAELYMNNTATKSLTSQEFIADAAPTTIIDRGAFFRTSESSVASCKATLPSNSAYSNFISGASVFAPGEKVSKAGTFTTFNFDDATYGILDGVSVRSIPGEYGLRFTAYVSKDLIDVLPADTEYGMVIYPTSANTTDPAAHKDAVTVKAPAHCFETEEDQVTFHGAKMFTDLEDLKGICITSYTAVAYYTVKDSSGNVSRMYTPAKEGSTRSMYSSVNNLCKADSAYAEHPAVKAIMAEAESLDANDIITSIFPEATVIQSSANCKEIIISNAGYSVVASVLVGNGFKKVSFDGIENAKMQTHIFQKNADIVTIYWHSETYEMRIFWEKTATTAIEAMKSNDKTGTGKLEVMQVGIERITERDNPLNGMCYITKLSDGSVIILDGGMNNSACAKNLYGTLEKMNVAKDAEGRYIIRAWIFSHYHGDHTGTVQTMGQLYRDKITVEYIMHAFSGDANAASTGGNIAQTIANYFPEAKHINPHGGIKYYFDNATISMLYTPDMLYSYGGKLAYDNDTSIIYKLEGGGTSVLFFGDSGEEAAKKMWNAYDVSTFTAEILQITHHGLYTAANNGHTWNYVRKVYEATGAKYAFLPMHSKYGPDSRNGRFTVMIQWCDAGYQISFVMNESDKHGKSSIDQAYYTKFVEDVRDGKNTYDTLYGYNGINKIVNEQGMITYTGGNNYTPMITVFELGDGKATLTLNEELYAWLGVDNSQG